MSIAEIAEMMVGRRIENLADHSAGAASVKEDEVAVRVRDLYVDMPGEAVNGVGFEVRRGEIFGIGGLAGQGKVGIPNGIMGIYPARGEVEIFGQQLEFTKLGDALDKGVSFVSEDRRGVGLLPEESIVQNIVFKALSVQREFLAGFGVFKLINMKKARRHAAEMVELLDIRCVGVHQRVGSLSGGNQQKVCLASALTLNPRLLIVSEPTRGIDIGAKKLILEYLIRLRDEEGLSIIMVSSELAELRSVCDRIAIVSDGQISSILTPDAPDVEYGLAMSAAKRRR